MVGDQASSGVEPDHRGLIDHWNHSDFNAMDKGELLDGFDVRSKLSWLVLRLSVYCENI